MEPGAPLTGHWLRGLHATTVAGLQREGDANPGAYRLGPVTTIKAGTVKAGDLEAAMPTLNANQRTYQIRKLVDVGMLQPTKPGARQYSIGFSHNILLRGVVRALTDEGFISPALVAPPAHGGA